jgi:hypothetical protein
MGLVENILVLVFQEITFYFSWKLGMEIKVTTWLLVNFVATLALGLRPRQGFARTRAKRETRECGKVWEWTFTFPNELPCWELESWWTPKSSKSDCKGQNPSPRGVIYIIEKLLKHRCLKWLSWPIWTFKTQVMVKRRVMSQTCSLTPNHRKSGIDSISLRASGIRHVVETLLTRVTTLIQTLSRSKVCTKSYSPAKSREFHPWQFRDSRDKKSFGWGCCREVQSILYGGRWWLPPSPGCGESC